MSIKCSMCGNNAKNEIPLEGVDFTMDLCNGCYHDHIIGELTMSQLRLRAKYILLNTKYGYPK